MDGLADRLHAFVDEIEALENGAQDGAQCPKNAAYKTNNGLQEADKA